MLVSVLSSGLHTDNPNELAETVLQLSTLEIPSKYHIYQDTTTVPRSPVSPKRELCLLQS